MNHTESPTLLKLVKQTERDLLPCPFCGTPHPEIQNTHTASYWVECVGCECTLADPQSPPSQSKYQHKQSIKRAAIAWNTRQALTI